MTRLLGPRGFPIRSSLTPVAGARTVFIVAGIVLIVLWSLATLWRAQVQPRPIFDASLYAAIVLVAACWALGRRSLLAWALGVAGGVVATLVGLYGMVSILFDPAIQFRPVYMLLMSGAAAAGIYALATVIRRAEDFGAGDFVRAAIAGSTIVSGILGALLAAYGVWYGQIVAPTDRPPNLDVVATLSAIGDNGARGAYTASITAKNTGGSRVLILGDAYNVFAGDSVGEPENVDSSGLPERIVRPFMCRLSDAMEPVEPIAECSPGPSVTAIGPARPHTGRAIQGIREDWQSVQAGVTVPANSWIDPGGTASYQFVVTGPTNVDVIRYEATILFGRADRLGIAPEDAFERASLCQTEGQPRELHLAYRRVAADAAGGLVAALNPQDFEIVWHLSETGIVTQVCANSDGTYGPVTAGDPRNDAILRELGLAQITVSAEASRWGPSKAVPATTSNP